MWEKTRLKKLTLSSSNHIRREQRRCASANMFVLILLLPFLRRLTFYDCHANCNVFMAVLLAVAQDSWGTYMHLWAKAAAPKPKYFTCAKENKLKKTKTKDSFFLETYSCFFPKNLCFHFILRLNPPLATLHCRIGLPPLVLLLLPCGLQLMNSCDALINIYGFIILWFPLLIV